MNIRLRDRTDVPVARRRRRCRRSAGRGRPGAGRLRRLRHRQRGRRQRRRLGRPREGHPDRRRPEGRLQGAAPGRRRARRRAVRDRVEGVHLRTPAARGAQRRRDPHRRRRQHPAAVRGRGQGRDQGRPGARRTAARATRSSSRRTPTIKSVEDLKGKKVGVAEGSSANYNLLAQLEKAGLTYDDVQVENLQPADALAAFSPATSTPGRSGSRSRRRPSSRPAPG